VLLEYQSESPILPPATLASFLVAAENVVDFNGGYVEQVSRQSCPLMGRKDRRRTEGSRPLPRNASSWSRE